MDFDVVVVGAGASGLFAAAAAAARGRRTLLLEKNARPGAKILLSGGTRCNVTHAADARGIVAAFGPPGRFLHAALARLGPQDLIDLLAAEGVPTQVEPGGKVFPASDRAADVLEALLRRLDRSGCQTAFDEPLGELTPEAGAWRLLTSRRTLRASSVVLATGGQSYPRCGTTGDGYRLAAALGHTILAPRPALVPVRTDAGWVRQLQGVSLADVLLRVVEVGGAARSGKKAARPAQRRGAMLFAHFGLSGPAVLDLSRAVSGHPRPETLAMECDFLPAVAEPSLDEELRRRCGAAGRRQVIHALPPVLPGRLAKALLEQSAVAADQPAAELSKADRRRLVAAIKQTRIPVTGTLGFQKAEVTAGGVALDEVDPRTMQSKLAPGLFLVGELLDLDGPIGGYNFQAAFSTGRLAGENA